MTSPADIAARHSQMLSEFAELSFELAKDIQARALAADDAETAGRLAKDFHHVGRSLRQALALHARLQREHAGVVETHEAKAREAREIQVVRHKTRVGRAAETMVWNEFEDAGADEDENQAEMEFILGMLPDLVDKAAEAEDFLDASVEVIVGRIREALRAAVFDEVEPEEPAPEEPEERDGPEVRSSA